MAEDRTVQEIPLSADDRRRISELMAKPHSPRRDASVESILAKYVGFIVELAAVPEDHTHDGKKHEGLEVHFRRRHESFDSQAHEGDFCYRDPPGAAFVGVASDLVAAA